MIAYLSLLTPQISKGLVKMDTYFKFMESSRSLELKRPRIRWIVKVLSNEVIPALHLIFIKKASIDSLFEQNHPHCLKKKAFLVLYKWKITYLHCSVNKNIP